MSDTDALRRFASAAPGMFVVLRPDADFTIAAASAEYLQATRTDLSIVGRPLFDVFPDNPALQDAASSRTMRASIERVRATAQPDAMALVRYDLRLPGSTDDAFEERYWSPSNVPMFDADGRLEYIMHRVVDATVTTDFRAVEILESITEGFFTLDRQWRFDYVNAEAHRILGVDHGALARRVIWEAYPGLEETPFWSSYHQTMDTRAKTSFTAYYPNQDRWYEVTSFPAPQGISVYFRNVSEAKLLEAQREALVQLSRRLADSPDAAQAAFDGAQALGEVLQASRVGYGTVDHESGHLTVERDWTRQGVVSLQGVTAMRDYGSFLDNLRSGELIVVPDVREDPRTAGAAGALEERHVRAFVSVPVLERGLLVAVLFVNDDVPNAWTDTELGFIQEVAARTRTAVERANADTLLRASEEGYRRLSDELAQAGRMKDEFLATLAHELRNPLAPIRNALKIQSLGSQDPALIRKTRELMERQVAHMVRLIDDLLDLSRLSRGQVELKAERLSLSSIVGLALEASRPLVEQSSHALAVNLPGEDLVVMADPVRLVQVVTNLLNNAAKFTPQGGQLALALERRGDSALIRVRDNGIGLRQDMLERVFNMFEQVDRSYAQVGGGLGIGLTLVRQLVHAHGGTVHAASPGLGAGSEFTVVLPLAQAPGHALGPGPEARPTTALAPQRILIADDNQDAATSLAMLLELGGHATRVVTDGAQAVALLDEFEPTVAILDIAMPVLDGLGAARAIRASRRGEQILVIALSGFGQEADKQRSAEAGMDEHLVKPVDLRHIDRILASHSRWR